MRAHNDDVSDKWNADIKGRDGLTGWQRWTKRWRLGEDFEKPEPEAKNELPPMGVLLTP